MNNISQHNIKKYKNKGLHFAIPVSLFTAGILLILVAMFTVAKPIINWGRLFISIKPASSSSTAAKNSAITSTSSGVAQIIYSPFGQQIGTLSINNAGIITAPVFHGDQDEQLRKGIGQFTGGLYPGEGGKIILDAHRETYFKNLKNVHIGDEVDFTTIYGNFVYKVNDIKILNENDQSIIQPDNTKEYLVMYTCYPFDTIGYKPQRYVVYANYVSGTKVQIPNK